MTSWVLSMLLAAGMLAAPEEKTAQESPPSPPPAEAAEREAREAARAERRKAQDEARKAQNEARRAAAEARRQASERARQEREQERQRQAQLYEQAMRKLYDKDWEDAVRAFSELAEAGGRRADAALYWQAYAEAKRGQAAAALATLDRLRTDWPESRWQRQAQILALEIQPPEASTVGGSDDDVRLLALGRRLDEDPTRSVPALEKLLKEPTSPRAAERALFLLSQSDSKEARELLLRIARGQAESRLQKKAIEYVGLFGNDESRRVLESVYSGAASRDVKRAVLRGYLLSGNKAAVLAVAQSERDEALKAEAIRQLGVMSARRELVALVGSESSLEARKSALQALSLAGDAETLVEVARTGKDPALQVEAARMLGLLSREKTGPALVSLCRESNDPALRRAALQGLFMQQNDQALVEVARKEKDPAVRRDAVRYLSLLGSSLSREFLSEMLDK
jgi:hypothetical protein